MASFGTEKKPASRPDFPAQDIGSFPINYITTTPSKIDVIPYTVSTTARSLHFTVNICGLHPVSATLRASGWQVPT